MPHIKRLVIFAGPRCAGKSWLIDDIQGGKNTLLLSKKLEIEEPESWKVINANQLHTISENAIEQMIVHYNILIPWEMKLESPVNKEVLDIIDTSDEVTFATLWTAPDILVQRLKKRRNKAICLLVLFMRRKKQIKYLRALKRIEQLYLSYDKLLNIYNKWLKFCDLYPKKANLVMYFIENGWKISPFAGCNDFEKNIRMIPLA